ncbi:hypothetical protein Gotur_022092, partial [Gossypium turneri]
MWKNWYDHIPIHEPIIVLELAEQRGPLNPKRRADRVSPSAVPTQSPGPTPQATTPTPQSLQIMPGAYPSPYMYPSPHMFPFPSPMPGWNASPDASFFSMTLTQPMI